MTYHTPHTTSLIRPSQVLYNSARLRYTEALQELVGAREVEAREAEEVLRALGDLGAADTMAAAAAAGGTVDGGDGDYARVGALVKGYAANDDLRIDNAWPRLQDAFFNQMAQEIEPGRATLLTVPNICPEEMAQPIQRVAVIHSCTFADQSEDVLTEMLERMAMSGLLGELAHLWILNYGAQREGYVELSKEAEEIMLANKHRVSFMHVDNTCSQFEIPTLTSIRALSEHLEPETQILYMHTKGVSYAPPIPQPMTDWRRMMEHFLVEKHDACYHLLASGLIDAVGTTYRFARDRQFLGNFWWTTAGYVNQLRMNIVKTNTSNAKFDAETYILSAAHPRIYVMHEPTVSPGEDPYPRDMYTGYNSQKNMKCTNINVCL